ncbi:MAG: YjgP/YjgQ family permease [Deltaproteobacteria bacterium]|nr:YjgP/YjgQ family permease [Deltaproteobacteria bacterium]
MNILNRYLYQQFCKNFVLITSALAGIYFLVDFFGRMDDFMAAHKSTGLALKYFFLKIPFMVDMLQPICILLAGILTLGILNHNHEFMALKAGGISVIRITTPLFAAALFCTLIALGMAQWLLPATKAETDRIWYEQVRHQTPKGILRKGRSYYRGEHGIYTFIRDKHAKNKFTNFSYTQLDKNFKIEFMLTASKAAWQRGIWTFFQGQIKRPSLAVRQRSYAKGKSFYNIKLFDQTTLDLADNPADFFIPAYKSGERSISQLFHNIWSRTGDQQLAWVNFNNRLSFIFLGLPLICIGLPILLIIQQIWGRDLALAIPVSCGIAFAAWSFWSTSQSMARAGQMNPVLASWLMYVIVCPLGIWLLIRQDRGVT